MVVTDEDANDPPFKRICANYGLAMYFVQVLEHGIVNALVWIDLLRKTNGRWTPEEYDRYYESRFGETLRELSTRLEKAAGISLELKARLEESNRKRRYLAHHFFREAADAIALDQVDDFLVRLEDDRRFFHETDRMVDVLVQPIFERYGFTKEVMERAMWEYNEHLRKQHDA